MIARRHPLFASAPGTRRELQSLHFGHPGSGTKAVIQASLHADEVPAMLVAHHLRNRLTELERQGSVHGEIVLLPYANPIGLAQRLLHSHVGRFDLGSGENFNRRYPDLLPGALQRLSAPLTGERGTDVARVRAALREACAALPVQNELQSLRRLLLSLSIDADLVIDLHSDNDALLHLYTSTPQWPVVEPLARLLGAEVSLLANVSGDEPFDEACSTIWPRLASQIAASTGRDPDLADACVAITVELRGEADVDHALAARDAEALLQYLTLRGFIDGTVPAPLPALLAAPTPFAGCMPVTSDRAGVLVYVLDLGAHLRRGERIADVVDPDSGDVTAILSPVDGVLFARELRRFVHAGERVAKVAGATALRSGKLLSA